MIQFTSKQHELSCQLVAYPGYGVQTPTGTWKLRLSGALISHPEEYSFRKRMMIKMLGNVMKVEPEDLDNDLFKTRVAPFMAEARKRKQIVVKVGKFSVPLKKKTKSDGQFRAWISISDHDVNEIATVQENGSRTIPVQLVADVADQPAPCCVYLQSRSGVSVISDIDDTIKISGVGDRNELLANTFLREFRGVEGMAAVYRDWAEQGASFHYVSSSPWQLFDPLCQMKTAEGFPQGTIHLRNFRLHDQLLRKMRLRSVGKSKAIRNLIEDMPSRRFILVGDSGEKDPEIYLKICKKFPGRIQGLFIRELPQRPLGDGRLQKLNESLPYGQAARFQHAGELEDLARGIFQDAGRPG